MYLKGLSRKIFVETSSVAYVSSVGGSLGVFNISGYSRLTGFVMATGSATLTYKWGINSGTSYTSSGIVCNSGVPAIVDVLVYGKYADLSFTQAVSGQNIACYLAGELIR